MKPTGLFYRNDVISEDKGKKLISFLEKIQEEERQPNNRGRFPGKIRLRIGYGRDHEKEMPTELEGIVGDILESIKSSISIQEMIMFEPFKVNKNRVTINRYTPGMKLPAHKDFQKFDNAVVIGLTLCVNRDSTRRMRFSLSENGQKHNHDVLTRSLSGYFSFKDVYYKWKHESLGSKKQKGIIYSLTFRANC